jgi:aminoglycoside 6'-N-acetyltransferase I
MEINQLAAEGVEQWIDVRQLLSPYYSRHELSAEVERWEDGRTGVFIATDDGEPIGFSEVSMRDRAPGCSTSPVGYLEGWWVAEGRRQQGVGRALLVAAVAWARRRGASEMGSDAHVDNTVSIIAHHASASPRSDPSRVSIRRSADLLSGPGGSSSCLPLVTRDFIPRHRTDVRLSYRVLLE